MSKKKVVLASDGEGYIEAVYVDGWLSEVGKGKSEIFFRWMQEELEKLGYEFTDETFSYDYEYIEHIPADLNNLRMENGMSYGERNEPKKGHWQYISFDPSGGVLTIQEASTEEALDEYISDEVNTICEELNDRDGFYPAYGTQADLEDLGWRWEKRQVDYPWQPVV